MVGHPATGPVVLYDDIASGSDLSRFFAASSAIAILKWNVVRFAMHKPTLIARLARREFVHLLSEGLSNKFRQQN
jgi:hypothetical protein